MWLLVVVAAVLGGGDVDFDVDLVVMQWKNLVIQEWIVNPSKASLHCGPRPGSSVLQRPNHVLGRRLQWFEVLKVLEG